MQNAFSQNAIRNLATNDTTDMLDNHIILVLLKNLPETIPCAVYCDTIPCAVYCDNLNPSLVGGVL